MAVPQIKQNPLTGQILGFIASMLGGKFGREAQAEQSELQRGFAAVQAERERRAREDAAVAAGERLVGRERERGITRAIGELPPGGPVQRPSPPGAPAAPGSAQAIPPPARPTPSPRGPAPVPWEEQEPLVPIGGTPSRSAWEKGGEPEWRSSIDEVLRGSELPSVEPPARPPLAGGGLSLGDEPAAAPREGGPFGGLYTPREGATPEERYLLELKRQTPRGAPGGKLSVGQREARDPLIQKQKRQKHGRTVDLIGKRLRARLVADGANKKMQAQIMDVFKQKAWATSPTAGFGFGEGREPGGFEGIDVKESATEAYDIFKQMGGQRPAGRRGGRKVKSKGTYSAAQGKARHGADWPAVMKAMKKDNWTIVE